MLGEQQLGDIILGNEGEEDQLIYVAHGQAQAKINAFGVNQFGQTQSWIESTYSVHGQAQAQIKQIYYVHGQSQAYILRLFIQYGQAQGQILQTYNQHAQAQASMFSVVSSHGQARALILGIVLLDTFTRSVGSVATETDLGEPDIGPIYTDFKSFAGGDVSIESGALQNSVDSAFNYQALYVENSNLNLRGNFEAFADFYQDNSNLLCAYGEIDFTERTALSVTIADRSLGFYLFDNEFVLGGNLVSAITDTPFTTVAGTTYRIKVRSNGTTIRGKVWDIEDVEPDWMLTGTLLGNSVVSPAFYSDIGEGPNPGIISIDNITVLAEAVEPPIANITYIGSTATPLASTIGGVVAWPAGHQSGDIGLLFVEVTGGGTLSLTTAAGFANVSPGPVQILTGTSGTKLGVYWCRATSSSQTSPELADGGDHIYATILVFRGVRETGNPWDRTDAYNGKVAASTSLSILGLNNAPTRIPYTHVVLAASRDNDNAAAAFSNWSNSKLVGNLSLERHDAGTTQGNGGGLGITSGTLPDTTTIDTTTATVTSSINPAMIIALAPPRLISGQARAFVVGGQINQFGQAQANIDSPTKSVYGQANAYIMLVRNVFGQARAHILATTNIYAQANAFVTDGFKLRLGQAQALINIPIKSGQAQALILVHDNEHVGQARAVVHHIRRVYGQSNADIVTTYRAHAQTQAIITSTTPSGQAQAFIRQPIGIGQAQAQILRTFRGVGQAQAYIADYYHLYFQDTFSRVLSNDEVMGTPDLGAYGVTGQTWLGGFTIDGAVGKLHTSDYFNIYANFTAQDVIASIDFMLINSSDDKDLYLYTRYDPSGFPVSYVFLQSLGATTVLSLDPAYGSFVSEILDYALTANTWYTLKIETVGTRMRGKFWIRSEIEPDWMISTTITTLNSGGAAFEVSLNSSGQVDIDNFMVYRDGVVNPVPFTLVTGQAQAYITQPINRMYGQARTRIKRTFRAHGLARAFIGFRRRHGQAGAYIQKQYFTPSGQAQGFLWYTTRPTGLVRAFITKPQQVGQAQAKILAFGQRGSGNAQARILASVTRYGFAQCQAMLHQDIMSGQAAAMIDGAKYLVRFNNYDLPGYAQSEDIASVQEIIKYPVTYIDGSLDEYYGLRNKILSLQMKVVGETYGEVKEQTRNAATIVRSGKSYKKLYVGYRDRYYLGLTKKLTTEKSVGSSMRLLDYSLEFEVKPWLLSDTFYTLSGVGTITTDQVLRDIDSGGWTPATISVDGTNVTISGYNSAGLFTGYLSVSGSVTGLVIDSENYTATINGVNVNQIMYTPNYQMFAGPGKTTFVITGATRTTITYQNRWYL